MVRTLFQVSTDEGLSEVRSEVTRGARADWEQGSRARQGGYGVRRVGFPERAQSFERGLKMYREG